MSPAPANRDRPPNNPNSGSGLAVFGSVRRPEAAAPELPAEALEAAEAPADEPADEAADEAAGARAAAAPAPAPDPLAARVAFTSCWLTTFGGIDVTMTALS